MLGLNVHAIAKNRVGARFIVSGRERLPELLVFADQRIIHVELHVKRPRFHIPIESHPLGFVFFRKCLARRDDGVKDVLAHAVGVEIALPKEKPGRHRLPDHRELHLVLSLIHI